VGRPSKLTPEAQERVVQAIRAGNYAEVAAGYAGIHRATYYTWMKKGAEQDEGIYSEFHDAVKGASDSAETRAVAIIQKAMPDTWQAAAWYLERRAPGRWGRHERRDVNVTGAQPIAFQIVTQGEPDEASKPDDDES